MPLAPASVLFRPALAVILRAIEHVWAIILSFLPKFLGDSIVLLEAPCISPYALLLLLLDNDRLLHRCSTLTTLTAHYLLRGIQDLLGVNATCTECEGFRVFDFPHAARVAALTCCSSWTKEIGRGLFLIENDSTLAGYIFDATG